MQRGARCLILGVSVHVQHGPSEGVQNIYKTNAFLLIFKTKGTSGAAAKWMPNNKICKKRLENKCFCAIALGALWHPLGLDHFFGAHVPPLP